jgi:hypothetical protein
MRGRDTMKNALSLAMLTGLFCSSVVFAEPVLPQAGTVNVTVIDENGAVVSDAPVYIYGAKRSHFVGGADVPGSTTFTMKEGVYRISSALVKRSEDMIDRFASNEALVNVVAGDNVSVVLTLKALENLDTPRPVSYASIHMAEVPGNMFYNN